MFASLCSLCVTVALERYVCVPQHTVTVLTLSHAGCELKEQCVVCLPCNYTFYLFISLFYYILWTSNWEEGTLGDKTASPAGFCSELCNSSCLGPSEEKKL